MIHEFLTIEAVSESIYKEKGSKFLAIANPVASERAVKQHLDELKKKYHDANHHSYAYILGAEGTKYRANDDGEPNHSAGDPILGQIRSFQLTNVLVVVVRYFGGVKLGVGGLISAYKTASYLTLKNSKIVKQEVSCLLTIEYEYQNTPEVMRLIKEFELSIISHQFETTCILKVEVKSRLKDEFLEKTKLYASKGVLFQVNIHKII